MSYSHYIYNDFWKQIGRELKRVREEKLLSIDEATKLCYQTNPKVLENIERGQSRRFFLMFTLCGVYGRNIKIQIVDDK